MQKLKYSYGGKTQTIEEWAKEQGMAYSTMQRRLREYPTDVALTMGLRPHGKKATLMVTYNGEVMSIKELARRTKVPYETLRYRIKIAGMDAETAVTTPVRHWHGRKNRGCPYPDCEKCPYPDCVVTVI